MIIKNPAYSLDDLGIVPAAISSVDSRSHCDPYYTDFTYALDNDVYVHNTLPIFTSPMPSVINGDLACITNYLFNNITPVIPRTVDITDRMKYTIVNKLFVAFSLKEVEIFIKNSDVYNNEAGSRIPYKVCIDIANGNMGLLTDVIKRLKFIYGDRIIIMAGNVANPESYKILSNCKCDYVKVSVGTGSACTTATNTGIYMPMGTLLDECYNMKKTLYYSAKIVADGGIDNYRNLIKALALGADYVMLGSMLNKLKDSAGKVVEDIHKNKYKIHFGMASIEGQKALGKTSLRPPEGKVIYNKMSDLTIADFSKEITNYLQSTMSYCDKYTIAGFVGEETLQVLSSEASKQYNQTTENIEPEFNKTKQLLVD